MAFPYVSTSDDEKLENSLLSGFADNCNSGFERNDITYTDKCTVSGQDLYKYPNMDAINVRYHIIFLVLLLLYVRIISKPELILP